MTHAILMSAGIEPVGRSQRWAIWLRRYGARYSLIAIGMIQLTVAAAQIGGADFGMLPMTAHQSGAMSGAHLMNETTAWSLALGVGMIVAGAWPAAAAGVVCVLGVFVAVLTWYVVDDAMAGRVTEFRVLSHLPVVIGAVLAAVVYRTVRRDRRTPPAISVGFDETDIILPDNASRGRRRGLRSSTDSAA